MSETSKRIAEIRARLETANAEPYEPEHENPADDDLITHAPDDLEWLLARVEELEQELEGLKVGFDMTKEAYGTLYNRERALRAAIEPFAREAIRRRNGVPFATQNMPISAWENAARVLKGEDE